MSEKTDDKEKDIINDQADAGVATDDGANESAALAEENPKNLELEIDQLKAELLEQRDRYMRLAADFENFKKIAKRESLEQLKFANEGLIKSLLPIIDNLEQAVIAGKLRGDDRDDVLIGVEMVLKQMDETLKKFGVESFSAEGQKFDPARHEAMGEQEDDQVEPGMVITQYQKGFLLHERLLRPARVVVAKESKDAR